MQNLGLRLSRFKFALRCVAVAISCACVSDCPCVSDCHGADADSGWAISASPTLDSQVHQQFPSARSSVRQLLDTKEPLIRVESNRVESTARKSLSSKLSSKLSSSNPPSSLRIAERPDWQASRPAHQESSVTLNWEASRLSDFELRDAPAKPAAGQKTATPADNTTSVEFATEKPSSLKSGALSARSTRASDMPLSLNAAKSAVDIVIKPGADLHESFKSSAPPIKTPPTRKPRKEAKVAKGDSSKPSIKPAPVRKLAPKRFDALATSPQRKATQPRVASPAKTVAKPPVVKPLPPLSRNQVRLRGKMQRVLKSYYRRPLNSRDHDPWEIMHGMLAYGVYSRVLQDGPQGDPITAVGWLCYNKTSKRKTLLYVDKQGELRARWGVGVQGHYGQFLAMLAQCRVDKSYPIRVGAEEFTVEDLIAAEKKTCQPGEELSFKLIALMHYCPSDTKWMNEQGSMWEIPKLIHEELKQPIRGAPCGGTHRLSGLSLAVRTRIKRGEPVDGEYRRAQEFVERYERYALQFQNSDGSLSTEWFRGRGDDSDINRRIKTTGHLLEWLLYSQTDDEIQSSRTFNAANYLTNLMASNYSHDWEIGPLAHAIHALVLYDERVFQPHGEPETAKPSRPIASKQRQRQQRQRRSSASSRSKRKR